MPETPEGRFGQIVREFRVARGWSQQELADKLAEHGINARQVTVGRIETGGRPIRLNEVAVLAEVLGIDAPLELVTGGGAQAGSTDTDAATSHAQRAQRIKDQARRLAVQYAVGEDALRNALLARAQAEQRAQNAGQMVANQIRSWELLALQYRGLTSAPLPPQLTLRAWRWTRQNECHVRVVPFPPGSMFDSGPDSDFPIDPAGDTDTFTRWVTKTYRTWTFAAYPYRPPRYEGAGPVSPMGTFTVALTTAEGHLIALMSTGDPSRTVGYFLAKEDAEAEAAVLQEAWADVAYLIQGGDPV